MPCVTAFSTSGCRTSGGTRHCAAAVVDVPLDLQAVAEPHLFDAEKAIGQRELVSQRNPIARADAQRVAQKVGRAAGTSAARPPDRPSSAR